MVVLITGAAGFIGFHLARRLIADGCRVIGVDNLNDYYDVNLKYARLEQLGLEAGANTPGSSSWGWRRERASRRAPASNSGGRRGSFSTGPTSARRTIWPRFSPVRSPISLSIWRRRPGCAIRSRTPTPTSATTSSVS